eukprot:COSAG05_NODE_250_length_12887_cov_28.030810_14_plen_54_part_00
MVEFAVTIYVIYFIGLFKSRFLLDTDLLVRTTQAWRTVRTRFLQCCRATFKLL